MSTEWKTDEYGIRTWTNAQGWTLTIYPSHPLQVYGEGPSKVSFEVNPDDVEIEHSVGCGGQYGTHTDERVSVPFQVLFAALKAVGEGKAGVDG